MNLAHTICGTASAAQGRWRWGIVDGLGGRHCPRRGNATARVDGTLRREDLRHRERASNRNLVCRGVSVLRGVHEPVSNRASRVTRYLGSGSRGVDRSVFSLMLGVRDVLVDIEATDCSPGCRTTVGQRVRELVPKILRGVVSRSLISGIVGLNLDLRHACRTETSITEMIDGSDGRRRVDTRSLEVGLGDVEGGRLGPERRLRRRRLRRRRLRWPVVAWGQGVVAPVPGRRRQRTPGRWHCAGRERSSLAGLTVGLAVRLAAGLALSSVHGGPIGELIRPQSRRLRQAGQVGRTVHQMVVVSVARVGIRRGLRLANVHGRSVLGAPDLAGGQARAERQHEGVVGLVRGEIVRHIARLVLHVPDLGVVVRVGGGVAAVPGVVLAVDGRRGVVGSSRNRRLTSLDVPGQLYAVAEVGFPVVSLTGVHLEALVEQ